MRTFDRQGIHLERCEQCGGIFLDRGELEQIVSAEQQYYGSPPPYSGGGQTAPPPAYRGYKDSPRPYGSYPDSPPPYGHGRRKRRSFLESLFD